MAENIIQTLKVGNEVYELSAKYASNLDTNADLVWSNIDGLVATSASDYTGVTSGILTPAMIQNLVAGKTGTINAYQVVTSQAEMTDTHVIYLMKDETASGLDDQYKEYIVSYTDPEDPATKSITQIGDTSVDLTPYSTTTQVSSMITGYVDNATSAQATALWSNVEDYVADELNSALSGMSTSSTYWNIAYDAVSGAVTDYTAMSAAENADKLAQVGAITGYVDAKVAESIAETIDIATEIKDDTAASAIPNVGAVKTYVGTEVSEAVSAITQDKFLEKTDIKVEGTQLVIDNI